MCAAVLIGLSQPEYELKAANCRAERWLLHIEMLPQEKKQADGKSEMMPSPLPQLLFVIWLPRTAV